MLARMCAVVALPTTVIAAGPLTPPPGPIVSTMKTILEAEPRTAVNEVNTPGDADSIFRISQPGSYYLTGNITGVANKHGIEIAASGVTLDLNGFELVGVPEMGAFDGVTTSVTALTDIAVLNGSVRDWGDEGVDLRTRSARGSIVKSVRASGNTGAGVSVGDACTVSDSTASSNGSDGFSISNASLISGCTASLNTGNGIDAASGCTVAECNTYANEESGIRVATGSTVTGCAARLNAIDGIQCFSACVIRGNTCSGNGEGSGDGAGIHATNSANRIEENNCFFADRGIDVDTEGNFIVRNTCSANTINWSIAAGNVFGAILDRTALPSPAVNGNSAPGSLGTTDANANFTY